MKRSVTVKRQRLTDRERGASIAYCAAIERLHRLDREPQLDLFASRLALRREWVGIKNAALQVLA